MCFISTQTTPTPSKIEKPSELLLLLEGRTFFEMGLYFATMPYLTGFSTFPKGDGHPVLVLPGFMASDTSTVILRSFLTQLNYKAISWKLGRNLADFDEKEGLMLERVRWLYKRYEKKVSLIGWSLGGVYAREIARELPDMVRQVITLGSPFAGIGEESNANWVYEWISGKKTSDIDPDLKQRTLMPPPVPTTAFYTKTDGIVNWKTCLEQTEGPITENIEVFGSHCGLGHNPMVLTMIAERLAQKEGEWKRMKTI